MLWLLSGKKEGAIVSGFKGNGFTKLNSIFDIVTESVFSLQLSFHTSSTSCKEAIFIYRGTICQSCAGFKSSLQSIVTIYHDIIFNISKCISDVINVTQRCSGWQWMNTSNFLFRCIFNITLFAGDDRSHKLKIKKPFGHVIIFLPFPENLYPIFSSKSIPSPKDFPWLEIRIAFFGWSSFFLFFSRW